MNHQRQRELVRACPLPPSTKLVLLLLTCYADERGRAWPQRAVLQAETGLAERTLRLVLADLRAGGFIADCFIEERDVWGWQILNVEAAGQAATHCRSSGNPLPVERQPVAGTDTPHRQPIAAKPATHCRSQVIIGEGEGRNIPRESAGVGADGKTLPVGHAAKSEERTGEFFTPPTLDEVQAYALLPTSAIPEAVATDFFLKMDGDGWRNRHGHPFPPNANWRSELQFYARCVKRRGGQAPAGPRTWQGAPARPPTGGELMRSYAGTALVAKPGDPTNKGF